MSNKKILIIAGALVLLLGFVFYKVFYPKNYVSIMAVTGATPLALAEDVPPGVRRTVDGLTKRTYEFSGDALRALANSRLRTQEVSPEGKFQGTYIYAGIPVYNILEGVAPKKPETAAFDKPLDMIVTFTSSNGKQVHYSYGEILMVDDRTPLTLAYSRRQLLPSNEKASKTYDKNVYRENLKGLRLICPADRDDKRYLDDVVKITLRDPEVPHRDLPKTVKGKKCSSSGVMCLWKEQGRLLITAGVERCRPTRWIRVGHGMGYKGISTAEGYNLVSLLRKNFPGCGEDQYYLFVACDGYRVLFSGREIFNSDNGEKMMLAEKLDGKKLPNGMMLGPRGDYFVDRDVWGLTHIVVLDKI